MKKILAVLLVLLLSGTLTACAELALLEDILASVGEAETLELIPLPEEVEEEEIDEAEEPEEAEETEEPEDTEEAPAPPSETQEAAVPASFTLQQIEKALTPQMDFGGERHIDWEVLSAERVGINPPGTTVFFEPAGQYIDISNSVRYSVTVRWADTPIFPGLYWDDDIRLGKTETRDWNFFIVGGEPELVFLVC